MIDLAIVLAFIAYAVTAGLRARRKASRGLIDYFLAGKNVKGWRAGFSMAATQYAADTPLLVTGLMATGGTYLLWRFWIYGFGFLLLAFVFAEGWRRANVLTDAELTEVRYSGRGVLALRALKAVYYGTIVNCFFLAMVLLAAVRIAEVFLPWHAWLPAWAYGPVLGAVEVAGISLGTPVTALAPEVATANGLISIVAIVAFVFLYAATGGMRSVVATDVVQFVLMMVGTIAYAVFVVREVGGWGAFGERFVAVYGAAKSEELLALTPTGGEALFPFLMVVGLQGLFWIGSDGTGYLAQRAMACRSDHDARIAGVVFSWAQILGRSLVWFVIGAGLLLIYPFSPAEAGTEGFAAAREMTFVTGIDDLLPPVLRGVMLTALLAALASTVDTHLNWGASYWTRDLYERMVCQAWLGREPQARTSVVIARLSNVVVLVLALVIMVNLGSIQATWFISLVFGAGVGGVLMLRWLWERINLYGEAAALAISLAAAPVVLATIEAEWVRLGVMVLLGTGAAIVVSLLTPETRPDVAKAFYTRVRPVGFWRRTARDAGERPGRPERALRRRLKAIILMATSLLVGLAALVRLVVVLPGTSTAATWAALAIAVALVPTWWRYLRRESFDRAP
jgi:solute:Na+ symporter, SSS family